MVASDALLSVFSSLGGWIFSKKAHGGSSVPFHHVTDCLTVAVALGSTDGLANIGIRCWHSLQRGLWAVIVGSEILACLVTLGLGIETVNGNEILAGVGMGGAVTGVPVESVITAWTPALRAVGTRDFGADGGWNRPEGLGCFVFGGHGIGDGGLEVFDLEFTGGINHHSESEGESEHARKACAALEIVDPPCRIRFGFEVVAGLSLDEFEARRGEAECPLGLQRCCELFADLGGPFDLLFGSCECVHCVFWLIGASAPADVRTLTLRRVITREILNYFHGMKSRLFSPLNKLLSDP